MAADRSTTGGRSAVGALVAVLGLVLGLVFAVVAWYVSAGGYGLDLSYRDPKPLLKGVAVWFLVLALAAPGVWYLAARARHGDRWMIGYVCVWMGSLALLPVLGSLD